MQKECISAARAFGWQDQPWRNKPTNSFPLARFSSPHFCSSEREAGVIPAALRRRAFASHGQPRSATQSLTADFALSTLRLLESTIMRHFRCHRGKIARNVCCASWQSSHVGLLEMIIGTAKLSLYRPTYTYVSLVLLSDFYNRMFSRIII